MMIETIKIFGYFVMLLAAALLISCITTED